MIVGSFHDRYHEYLVLTRSQDIYRLHLRNRCHDFVYFYLIKYL